MTRLALACAEGVTNAGYQGEFHLYSAVPAYAVTRSA
jgi:hypothetical protein